MEKFDYPIGSSVISDCYWRCSRYNANGNLALMIESSTEGPVMTVTVNMNEPVTDENVCIKNWSENQDIDDFLKQQGIIEDEDAVYEVWNDFVSAPVYRLTEKGRQIFRENLKDYKL